MGSKRKLLESKDCVDGLYISEVWTKSMLTKGYTQNKKEQLSSSFTILVRVRTGTKISKLLLRCSHPHRSTYIKFNNNYSIITTMKTKNKKTITPQVRFTLALNATWSILRDPVLTKLYARHWKRYITRATKEIAPTERLLTLYGFVFNVMYHEV